MSVSGEYQTLDESFPLAVAGSAIVRSIPFMLVPGKMAPNILLSKDCSDGRHPNKQPVSEAGYFMSGRNLSFGLRCIFRKGCNLNEIRPHYRGICILNSPLINASEARLSSADAQPAATSSVTSVGYAGDRISLHSSNLNDVVSCRNPIAAICYCRPAAEMRRTR